MPSPSTDYFSALRKYETAPADMVIRRYLTAKKFEHFAQSWQLWFSPASAFTDDPEEGFFTVQDEAGRVHRLKQLRFPDRGVDIAREAWIRVCKNNAKTVVISCWTMGIAEDRRMWVEYGESPRAVAIETTLGALRSVLGTDLIAAPVNYINRDRDRLPESHPLEPFLYKGKKRFAWEKELRFIANMEMGRRIGSARMFDLSPDTLPIKLILAPGADRHRKSEVGKMLGHHLDKIPIRPSMLLSMHDPLCGFGINPWCRYCQRIRARGTVS